MLIKEGWGLLGENCSHKKLRRPLVSIKRHTRNHVFVMHKVAKPNLLRVRRKFRRLPLEEYPSDRTAGLRNVPYPENGLSVLRDGDERKSY